MTREQVPVTPTHHLPVSLARITVPHARPTYSVGDFGALLLLEQTAPGLSILYKTYYIRHTTSLYETTGTATFYLCMPVNRALRCQQQGLSRLRIPEGQFNIFYANPVHTQYWFEKGRKYQVYELHYTAAMLEPLRAAFPIVDEFLLKTELAFSGQLGTTHTHITPEMLRLLEQICTCPFTGVIKDLYLHSLAARLLLLAVTRLSLVKTPAMDLKLQPYELSRLREAWEYLVQHLDQPGTLTELSQVVGLNSFKLKRGFKQLYGITIFEFLLEARMEKAKRLLRESDMSVHAVAISVGYRNISSFTVAFKKKYGILPSETQKIGRGAWPG